MSVEQKGQHVCEKQLRLECPLTLRGSLADHCAPKTHSFKVSPRLIRPHASPVHLNDLTGTSVADPGDDRDDRADYGGLEARKSRANRMNGCFSGFTDKRLPKWSEDHKLGIGVIGCTRFDHYQTFRLGAQAVHSPGLTPLSGDSGSWSVSWTYHSDKGGDSTLERRP